MTDFARRMRTRSRMRTIQHREKIRRITRDYFRKSYNPGSLHSLSVMFLVTSSQSVIDYLPTYVKLMKQRCSLLLPLSPYNPHSPKCLRYIITRNGYYGDLERLLAISEHRLACRSRAYQSRVKRKLYGALQYWFAQQHRGRAEDHDLQLPNRKLTVVVIASAT